MTKSRRPSLRPILSVDTHADLFFFRVGYATDATRQTSLMVDVAHNLYFSLMSQPMIEYRLCNMMIACNGMLHGVDVNTENNNSCSNASGSFIIDPVRASKVRIVNMPSVGGDQLPASLREELRRTITVKGSDILFKKPSMKACEQRQLMYDLFHRNQSKNVIASIHHLCQGTHECAELFVADVLWLWWMHWTQAWQAIARMASLVSFLMVNVNMFARWLKLGMKKPAQKPESHCKKPTHKLLNGLMTEGINLPHVSFGGME